MVEEAPDPKEVSTFHFSQLRTLKFAKGDEAIPKEAVNLIATSSKYGLLFVGIENGFKVLKMENILDLDEDRENKNLEENYYSWLVRSDTPVLLSLSADQKTLAVCVSSNSNIVAQMYDISNFAYPEDEPSPFKEIPLASGSTKLTDFLWNPVVDTAYAFCLTDGSLHSHEVTGVRLNVVASLPNANATALCWSPKGKQLVVGKSDGSFSQYKPTLMEVKNTPVVNMGENLKVVNICWISTAQFAVLYLPAGSNVSPYLFIVSTPKNAPVTYTNFYDVCLGNASNPDQRYLMHIESAWGILLCASTDSIEIASLGDAPNWVQWDVKEDGKALLPGKDGASHAISLGVMYCSQRRIVKSEHESYAPMPILFVLTNNGLLVSFHMINSAPGSASLVRPSTPIGRDGEDKTINQEAGSKSVIQGYQLPKSDRLDPVVLPNSFQHASTPSGIQGYNQPLKPDRLDPVVLPNTFQHVSTPSNFQSGIRPVDISAMNSSSVFQPTPQKNISGPPFGVEGLGGLSFGATSSLLQKPMGGTSPFQNPVLPPSSTSTPMLPPQSQFVADTSPEFERFHKSSKGMAPVNVAAPNISGGSRQMAVAQRLSTGGKIELDKNIQSVGTPPSTKSGNVPQVSGVNASFTNQELLATHSTYINAVFEEIQSFEKELEDLKKSSECLTEIGTDDEMATLKSFTLNFEDFQKKMKETMMSLNSDIYALKNVLLESFVNVEEANSRERRKTDHLYQSMLKERALDPITAKRMQKIDQHYLYLSTQLQEVNDKLDLDWFEFLEKKRDDQKAVRHISSAEAMYKAVINNQKIIHNLRECVNSLSKRASDKRLENISRRKQTAQYLKRYDPEELSKLADAFLNTKIASPEEEKPVYSTKLSPQAQNILRNYLTSSPVKTVRPTAYSITQSRLISKSLLYADKLEKGTIDSAIIEKIDLNANTTCAKSSGQAAHSSLDMSFIPSRIPKIQSLSTLPASQPFSQQLKPPESPLSTVSAEGLYEDITPPDSPSILDDSGKPTHSGVSQLSLQESTPRFHNVPFQEGTSSYPSSTSSRTLMSMLENVKENNSTSVFPSLGGFSFTPSVPKKHEGSVPTSHQFMSLTQVTEPKFSFSSSGKSNAQGSVTSVKPAFVATSQEAPEIETPITSQPMGASAPFPLGGSSTFSAFSFSNNPAVTKELSFFKPAASLLSSATTTVEPTKPITTLASFPDATTLSSVSSTPLNFGQTPSLQSVFSSPTAVPAKTTAVVSAPQPLASVFSLPATVTAKTTSEVPPLQATVSESSLSLSTEPGKVTSSMSLLFGNPSSSIVTASTPSLPISAPSAEKGSSELSTPPTLKPENVSITTSENTLETIPDSLNIIISSVAGGLAVSVEEPPKLEPAGTTVSAPSSVTASTVVPAAQSDFGKDSSVVGLNTLTQSPFFNSGSTPVTTVSLPSTTSSVTTTSTVTPLVTQSTLTTTAPFGSVQTTSATTAAPFGSTNTSSASAPFGSTTTISDAAPFGTATTTTPVAAPFGTAVTTAVSAPFGSANTTTATTPFVSPTTSIPAPFGASTTTSTAASPFGSAATTTTSVTAPFGAATTTPSAASFGTATTTPAAPTFGDAATTVTPFGTAASPFGSSADSTTITQSSFFGSPSSPVQSPFGSTAAQSPSFGLTAAVANQSTSPFGSQPTTTQSSFAQGTGGFFSQPAGGAASVFGAAATGAEAPPFGSQSAAAGFSFGKSPFGQNTGSFGLAKSVFGQTQGSSAPAFGQPASPGQGSTFGQSTGNGGFGQGSFFSGLGGKPSAENASKNVFAMGGSLNKPSGETSVFGGGSFGQGFGAKNIASFGSGAFSSGGSVAQSGFGGFQQSPQKAGGFGGAPTFGSAPSFGSPPSFGGAPAFGGGGPLTSVFGSSQQASNFSSFASASSPTFGSLASQGGGFGQSGESAPSFGQSSPFGGSAFGGSPAFGSQSSSFGSPSAPQGNSSAFSQWRS